MDEVKIYKITNQITKKVYIGQTTKENLEERLSQHSSSSDCPKLHNAIKLYGKENFKIELLDTCSKEQANYIESFFINKYHSIENGYNSIYSSGEFQTEQPRKRMGKIKVSDNKNYYYLNFEDFDQALAYFLEHQEEILNTNKLHKKRGPNGSAYNDSQLFNINLMSIINDWMKPKAEIKDIFQYDLDLNFVAKYSSCLEAVTNLQLEKIDSARQFISEVARGRKRIGYGYVWSYLNPQHLKILYNILNDYLTNE